MIFSTVVHEKNRGVEDTKYGYGWNKIFMSPTKVIMRLYVMNYGSIGSVLNLLF